MTGNGVPNLPLHTNSAEEICICKHEKGRPLLDAGSGTGEKFTLF